MTKHTRRAQAAATLVALALLAACTTGAEPDDEPPGGAEPDDAAPTATADGDRDYAALLADMDPVTLQVQALYGPDNLVTQAFAEYGRAVEEVTDGKISFEMYYSGSLVPITELEEGMVSGLIDMAGHITIYSPATFPVSNLTSSLGFVGEGTPVVGTLQRLAANIEFGFRPEHHDEMTGFGLQPIVPLLAPYPNFHLLCSGGPATSLAETTGKRVRVASPLYGAEAESLGMEPVQLVGAETFEGLQRGIVDCVIGTPVDARDQGLIELGDHWTVSPDVAFAGFTSYHISMSKRVWDELPVAAQQVLWDLAVDVYVRNFIEDAILETANALQVGAELGVEFHTWEPDAAQALRSHQDSVIEQARGQMQAHSDDPDGFVDEYLELHDKWLAIVEELGYGDVDAETWFGLAAEERTSLDVDAFIDRLIAEVFEGRRPT